MEDIAEGIFKILARPILFIARAIVWLTWEIMCEKMLWYLGWPASKLITLGFVPRESITNGENEHPAIFVFVALVGLAYPIAITYYLTKYLSS